MYNIEAILQCTYVASNGKFHLTLLLRSFMVNTRLISSFIMLYQTHSRLKLYSNLLVFGLFHPRNI